jgi:Holliday junction resolvase
MIMNNTKIGNKTETKIVNIFREFRYWVYNTPHKTNGQPVDIIAMNDRDGWLVDAKHVETGKVSFSFSRIEPNQITTCLYAKEFAKIKNLGFAIEFDRDGEVYWLPFEKFLEMSKNGEKSVNMNDLKLFRKVLEENEDVN